MGNLTGNNRTGGKRRILMIWCIVCVFALQCFAVVSLLPMQAFAADGDLTIHVEYKNGKKVAKTVSLSDVSKIKPKKTKEVTITEEDEEGNPVENKYTVNAITLKQLVELADIGDGIKGLGYGDVGIMAGDFDKILLIYPMQEIDPEDTAYRLYYPDGTTEWDELDMVTEFDADRSDVSEGTMTISPGSATLKEGQTKKFSATLKWDEKYKAGNPDINNNIKWSSSNSKVATVDKSGKVTAKKKGSAVITASAEYNGKVSASANVKVGEKETTNKSSARKSYTYKRGSYRSGRSYRSYSHRSYTRSTTRSTTSSSQTTETSSTAMKPVPGMMTVKEVTLTSAQMPDSTDTDAYTEDEAYDDSDYYDEEDAYGEEDWDEDGVDIGTGVGSAAVAAAACGMGAVGRVRRFRTDMMGPKVKTPKDPSAAKKNPLKKIIKKK